MTESEASNNQSKQSAQGSESRVNSAARRRWRKVGIGVGGMACLAFMAAGTVFGRFYWGSKSIRELFNGHVVTTLLNVVTGKGIDADWVPEKQFPDRSSMNVLILGCDHDYDNRDQIIRTTPGRSDSILLARVDFIGKRIDALTIPRDTAVRIPGHRGISKINAAHEFGGPELSIETIKSVFGVDTDAYVSLNFEGFQKIVDTIGGIDVNVSKKLDYDDNWGHLHIHLKPGYQHLNGYNAMGFVRMRHSDSDEMRSKRQHEFLEAMRTKIKQRETFFKIPDLVNALSDNLKKGRLNNDQLLALMNFARSLPKESIHVETLPSFEGPSYVTVDREKSQDVIQRLFYPNQAMAFNIDAPDPNDVRGLNARYDRSARHAARKRGHDKKPADANHIQDGLTSPPVDLSVEHPAPVPTAPLPQEPSTSAPGVDSGDKDKDKDKNAASGAAG